MSLAEPHDVVQVAMGWTDTHLHEFDVDGVTYGVPNEKWSFFNEVRDESKTKLFRVVGEGGRLGYSYDFGDGWCHTLKVEKVLAAPEPGVRYPRCVAGRRACPPEDVGGTWGYAAFLEAVADPEHEEHESALERIWGSFDPAAFDLADVDEPLRELAWSPAPGASAAPGRPGRAGRAGRT